MRFRRNKAAHLILLGIVAISGPTVANDSTATLGAGGLELATSADIIMESEDLFLSPQEIRVRYVFRNESDRVIKTRVAFPMPEVPFGPMDNVELPDAGTENFVNFSVTIDGQAVKPELEERAVSAPVEDAGNAPLQYPEGSDMTHAVRQAGLPMNANLPDWKTALQALPADARSRLIKDGVLYDDSGDGSIDDILPQWSLRETYHWEQAFPSKTPVTVEHRYKPVVGSSFFTGDDSDLDTIRSQYEKPYCLDKAAVAGVKHLLDKAKSANAHGKDTTYLYAVETQYVLKTGANWKGDIGLFNMTLDKLHQDAVLSTCLGGIKKTGSTTFEMRQKQYNPKDDVSFVIFRIAAPS